MTQITLSDELARQISEASAPIMLIDSHGRTLGQVAPVAANAQLEAKISDEEWAEIKRRMASDDGTRYTWAEVKEHLRSLAPE
jgi:hypothetical protein